MSECGEKKSGHHRNREREKKKVISPKKLSKIIKKIRVKRVEKVTGK
mgnify:CR=1 FL=1